MFNLREKIQEVEYNIQNLKKAAKKHFERKDYYKYKTVCDVILENEKNLAQLNRDLHNQNKILIKQNYAEQYH